jgi:hypothetical protein
MKVERKLSDIFVEKWKRNENMEEKRKSAERKRKRNFFGRSGNRNGTAIFSGTDAEMEVSVFD